MWQIIGQNKAVYLLERSLKTGSLSHAYLFVGPAHVGKMTLALNLAQAMNCESVEPPCGECPSCQKIISLKHADVQVMVMNEETSEENRTKISVSQIEDMQRSANLPPFEGKRKVFIVDGAEWLSVGAANRLLKTLEEPVGNVVFILLTADDKLLLPTIVSRCQRLELFPVSPKEIEDTLKTKWSVEAEKAKLLARLSHGCPGWAISATREESLLLQHTEALDKWLDIGSADAEERFAYATQLANQFSQNRGLVYQRLNLWLDWWRDLLLVKAGSADSITNIDRIDILNDLAQGLSLAQIRAFIQSIRAVSEHLRQNASPRLALEVLMLDIPEVGKYSEVAGV
ncbi:MAG: DNA polymerase III subunit [Chloroflexi bacterium]|nr:DNA polymerase III subunit [Chloroflexota bacterium]